MAFARGDRLILVHGAALLLLASSCASDPRAGAHDRGGQAGGPPAAPPDGGEGGGAEIETLGLRRLTQVEYTNTVRDLLGDQAPIPSELDADRVSDEHFELREVGASQVCTSSRGVELYEAAALDLAHFALADERREQFVGCAPAGADDPCVESFLATFGRRAFRRPLEADEVARYQAVVAKGEETLGDVWRGLEYATAALLQSPYFLYRSEIGERQSDSRRRLSGFEVASRLSFLLQGSTPDDALLDAAEHGALDTSDGLRGEAERLLASPRAEESLSRFLSEWLGTEKIPMTVKDSATYPTFSPALADAMRKEVDNVLSNIVFTRSDDFMSLFVTRDTFINGDLALLYGAPGITGDAFVPYTFPVDGARAGLMTFAGVLASNARATMTSPTLRGKYLRERLFCQLIHPPPPGVVPSLPPPPSGMPETMRQRLARHRTDPSCAGCHDLMDPPGLALEHFDAVGAYRETDGGLPIDATGVIDGASFDGGRGLGEALQKSPVVAACVARQLYRQATGHVEGAREAPLVDALIAAFERDGHQFKKLVLDVVTSEAFRYAGESS